MNSSLDVKWSNTRGIEVGARRLHPLKHTRCHPFRFDIDVSYDINDLHFHDLMYFFICNDVLQKEMCIIYLVLHDLPMKEMWKGWFFLLSILIILIYKNKQNPYTFWNLYLIIYIFVHILLSSFVSHFLEPLISFHAFINDNSPEKQKTHKIKIENLSYIVIFNNGPEMLMLFCFPDYFPIIKYFTDMLFRVILVWNDLEMFKFWKLMDGIVHFFIFFYHF